MYADKKSNVTANVFIAASPEEIKIKYDVLDKDVDFSDMVEKVGGWNRVAATFDDHDFGINDGDKSYAHIPESQRLFWDFTEEPADSQKRKQSGVYSSKEYSIDLSDHVKYSNFLTNDSEQLTFTYKIVMLDTRSNRDVVPRFWQRSSDSRTTDGDFLGEEQWSWLAKELRSDVDLVILGSSIQLLQTDKFVEEYWGMFPRARERMISLVLGASTPNVIVLSGDVHYAEVSKMKCTWKETPFKQSVTKSSILWELTSSGLTHTFYRKAPLKSNTLTSPADYSTKSRPQLLKAFVYNLYQAAFPSHYRELRYSDHYSGMNFGLLDINVDSSYSNSEQRLGEVYQNQCPGALEDIGNSTSGCVEGMLKAEVPPTIVTSVTFRAMNHLGEAVITKTIPLQAKSLHQSREDVSCEPIWGKVPLWRTILMYFTVFAPIAWAMLASAAAVIFALRMIVLSASLLLKC
jgi:PhoD-like phosphatase